MRLLNCHIVNFGCLSDRSYCFKDGLNVLYAENGSGKSTLTVFLKAMLYGLPVTGKRDLAENERKRYKPWGGGIYGGSLEFEANGKSYRIERFFGAKEKDDRFSLYNLETGKPSEDFGKETGDELFGVDADGFERSLYISQRFPFLPPANNTIRTRLGNLLEASDDLGDYEGAEARLDHARKLYQTTGERGRIGDLSRAIAQKSLDIRAAEEAALAAAELRKEEAALLEEQEKTAEALEAVRQSRAAAERRRLLEEKGASYRRLKDGLDAERRALLPLEAFFAKHLPTDGELLSIEKTLMRAESCEAQLAVSLTSEKDQSTLASLRTRYGDAPPSAEELSELKQTLTLYREVKRTVEDTEKRENGELSALSVYFGSKEPSESELEAIDRAGIAFDNAEANLRVEEDSARRLSLSPLTLLFAILALISTVLATVGFVLTLLPLGITGAVCALAFAALGVLFYKKHPAIGNGARAEYEKCRKALCALLAPYRYGEQNPSVVAKLLFRDLARYRTLKAEEAAREAMHTDAKQRAEALLEKLSHALLRHGIHGEPETGLARLEREAEALTRLSAAQAENEARSAMLRASLATEKEALSLFLSHYPELSVLPFREAVRTVREKLTLSRESLARYESGKDKLRTFLEESGFDPDAPLPPYAGEVDALFVRERELSDKILALQAEISAKHTEAERRSAAAAEITVFTAERTALEAEKTDAEHTHLLIQTARELLTEAKEALSTRYLKDMEKHFDRYLGELSEANESYRFNTDLAVSTERAGERRSVEVLSRGEQDLIAFCARMSLVDAIFAKETPFLLLDDPFVNLDDKNYAHAFALLEKLSRRFQIVYTVCSASRIPK